MDKGRAKILTPVILFVLCIFMARMAGSVTAGMLLLPATIYLACFLALAVACRRRVSRFVRLYYSNRFYINAAETSREAVYETLILCGITAALLCIFATRLSVMVTGYVKGRFALYFLAAAIVLLGVHSVLSGFIEGMGSHGAALTLDIIHAVLFLLSPAGAYFGHSYGARLDKLLYTDDCAAAYAAAFLTAGWVMAELVMTLAVLILRRRILKRLSPLHETGKAKYLGEKPAYFRAAWQWMIAMCVPEILLIVSCVLLQGSGTAWQPGTLAGHYLPVVCLLGVLAALPYIDDCYRLPVSDDVSDADSKEAQASAGALFVRLVHKQGVFCFPVGAFLMALAEPLERAIFLMPDDDAIMTMSVGGFLAPLISFAVIFCLLLALTRRLMQMFLMALVSGAAGGAVAAGLILMMHSGPYAVALALIAGFLVFDVAAARVLATRLHAGHVAFLGMMMRPVCIAAACGLGAFLISAILIHLIGEIPTCIVCVAGAGLMYLILMAIFKGFDADELDDIPFGRLLERISMRGRR